jgi:hypothetical protein
MTNETGLATIETTLAVQRAPEVVLAEAHRAAAALKDVIDKKAKKVEFNGQTYLQFEDWQTVGRFYGIAPRIVDTKWVEYGDVKGFEARAEAVHVESARVISTADAMCLNDEEKWRARPKYVYGYVTKAGTVEVDDPGPEAIVWEPNPYKPGKKRPKKERVLQGEESVPLFQLRSMAQTRAAAKALRNALAWVVVLAGYQPTPAEELDAVVVETPTTPPASPEPSDTFSKPGDDVPFAYKPPRGQAKPAEPVEPKKAAPADEGRTGLEAVIRETVVALKLTAPEREELKKAYLGGNTVEQATRKQLEDLYLFLGDGAAVAQWRKARAA